MNKKQIERMNKINELIEVIASTDRKFFSYKDRIAKFIELKTTVKFLDEYTQKLVTINNLNKNHNFSHGGTLWRLVKDFKAWILTGDYSNGYGGLICTYWAYTDDGVEKVRNKGKEIGFIKEV